ncbi:hypothetical protein [Caulobacter sp. DWR1-3-2b1]|uniref:hypothetical protein n=1 Tax=Caulobacter sp. DWR1-3-2b1 TaxID=2804670 RepID=UPI003CF549DA
MPTLVLVAVQAGPAFGGVLGGAAPSDVPWLRLAAALILCLLLALAGALILRKRLGAGASAPIKLKDLLASLGVVTPLAPPQRRLRLVETVRLSHNIDICVMQLDDRDILVAATAQGVVQLVPTAASEAANQ